MLDLVEAELLHDRVGEQFTGVVVDLDEKSKQKGDITIQDPAIEAPVTSPSDLPLGEEVTVELAAADPTTRTVEFRLV